MLNVEGLTPADGIALPLTNIKRIVLASPSTISLSGFQMECLIKTGTITDLDTQSLSIAGLGFDEKLRAAVMQSSHSIVTESLRSLGTDIFKYIGPANNWKGNNRFLYKLGNSLERAGLILYDDDFLENAAAFADDNLEVKTVKLFDVVDTSTVEKVTDEGVEIRTVPHDFRFSVAARNPSHLAYFALSYLETDEQSVWEHTESGWKRPTTWAKNDIVFNNSILSSVTYFYELPNGKIWAGPVRKEGSKYTTNDADETLLNPRQTRNFKIQDFRNLNKMANVAIMDDFMNEKSVIENIEAGTSPQIRELNPSRTMPHPYISDAFMSYDPTRRAKFVFMINFEDFIFDNSLYHHLWKTPYTDIRGDILSKSRIKSIKVFRQKVKEVIGNNSLATSQKYIPEKDEVPQLVSVTGQGQGSTVASTDSFREEANFSVPSHVRTFSVIDTTIPDTSRAQYRYYVEIEAYDGSKDFLREKITALKSFAKTLENYLLKILNSPVTTGALGTLFGKQQGLLNLGVTTRTSGYDPLYGSLTPDFASQMREIYWSDIAQGKAVFLGVIEIFSSAGDIDVGALNDFITLLLEPDSTNPENITSFLNLLNGVISKMVLSVGEPAGNSSESNSESVYRASSDSSNISVVKYFNTIFDLTEHEVGGYSYLSANTETLIDLNSFGLTEVRGESFRSRLQLETLKYYTNPTPNMQLPVILAGGGGNFGGELSFRRNLMSYLSPSQVVMGSPSMSFNAINILNSQTEGTLKVVESKLLANRIFYDKTGFSFPENGKFGQLISDSQPDNELFSANYLQSFLAQSFSLTDNNRKYPSQEQSAQSTDNSGDKEEDDATDVLDPLSLAAATSAPASLYDSLIRQEFLMDGDNTFNFGEENAIENALRNYPASNLPNQIIAFLLTNAQDSQDVKLKNSSGIDMIRDSRYSSSTMFNYRLLTRVEYLKSFEDSGQGTMLLSAPTWETLDEVAFASLAGKRVLCRLAKYNNHHMNAEWGLSRPEKIDMKIYDEYFILIPDSINIAGAGIQPDNAALISPGAPNYSYTPYQSWSEFGTTSLDLPTPPVPLAEVIQHLSSLETGGYIGTMSLPPPPEYGGSEDSPSLEQVISQFKSLVQSMKMDAQIGILKMSQLETLGDFTIYFSANSTTSVVYPAILELMISSITDDEFDFLDVPGTAAN